MKGYPIYELSEDEFEQMVNIICQKVLGTGVVSFTKGKDGGKDGRFQGVAQKYPSEKSPWSGKFIIQSKHTNNPIASFSDADFFTIIKKETQRVLNIKNNEGLDNYMIFTNRKHTSIVGDNLIKNMRFQTQLNNIEIIGLDTLVSYLRQNSNIVELFGLEDLKNPLRIHPDDIKEVIIAFDKNKHKLDMRNVQSGFGHIDIETKNKINKLNEEYFSFIKDKSQAYFNQISKFLEDPKNKKFLNLYENIVSELQAKIITNRGDFDEFNKIIEYYYDFILVRCPELKKIKRLIRVFLHFMYWSCDIGKKEK